MPLEFNRNDDLLNQELSRSRRELLLMAEMLMKRGHTEQAHRVMDLLHEMEETSGDNRREA